MKETRMDKRLLIVLYTLAFILLREWLLPVMSLTDTDYLGIFMVFIGLSFLSSLFRVKWWISVPVKGLYILWAVHFVFLKLNFFTTDSLSLLLSDLMSNFSVFANGEWGEITNPFRTILFFVLLWMTAYLIRHWIEVRKSILLFYVMTVVFIAFIDTFSPYSAENAIFRIMVSGLLLVGLLYISRLSEKHHRTLKTGVYAAISLPLLFVVVASSAFASIIPEKDPVWPDPVPFLKSVVQGGQGAGTIMSTSGYDPDDSVLGGPFTPDHTLVFEAKVPSKQYWKIETKSTYTSKGWEQSSRDGNVHSFFPGEPLEDGQTTTPEDKELQPQRAELRILESLPYVAYPYGTTHIDTKQDTVVFHQLFDSEKILATKNNAAHELDTYEIEFNEPKYSMKALRETSMDGFAGDIDFSPYLQLPREVPDRVKELARTITENEESVYDKAKAVERYFRNNGFTYDQKNVPIPSKDEDYVDQFLFDTKRGYCDNFSTSMVVLLRSVDIPARWVKGFAPGESKMNSQRERIYEITNNEAHSWVEAYMPGIGWIPFEPTIGFTNMTSISYDIETSMDDPEAPEMRELEKQEKEKETPIAKAENNPNGPSGFEKAGTWVKSNVWKLVILLSVIAAIVWRIFTLRHKWMPKLLVRVYQKTSGNWDAFDKQYNRLLRQMDRFGIKRSGGMTLSEYAMAVDCHFGGSRMRELTAVYEQGVYGGHIEFHDWPALQEIWEDLIIRSAG
ncbi:transglutaminase-like putative cysteine protease [Sporosarcina luteola]|nr:transglutaminase-like putative cysteine protease [Sporosarcina luteola]